MRLAAKMSDGPSSRAILANLTALTVFAACCAALHWWGDWFSNQPAVAYVLMSLAVFSMVVWTVLLVRAVLGR